LFRKGAAINAALFFISHNEALRYKKTGYRPVYINNIKKYPFLIKIRKRDGFPHTIGQVAN